MYFSLPLFTRRVVVQKDQLTVGGTGFVVAAPDATSPDWRITLGHFNSDCFMEVTLASSDVVLQYDSKSGTKIEENRFFLI